MWRQDVVDLNKQKRDQEAKDAIASLEKIREKRRQEEQAKEDTEWEQNQAEFLKKRVKNLEQRISELEGIVLQLASQLKKQSNGNWELDWNNI